MVSNGFHLLKGIKDTTSEVFANGYKNSPVSLTTKGSINATATRIDFSNSYWINQFDDIKSAIKKIRPIMPTKLSDWVNKYFLLQDYILVQRVYPKVSSLNHIPLSQTCVSLSSKNQLSFMKLNHQFWKKQNHIE